MSRAPTLASKLLNSTMKMKNETPLLTVPSRSSLKKHAFYGILALVSLLGLGITQSAKANTITTFDVSGTCTPQGAFTGTTFGGTLTIDATIGQVTAMDVSFQGFSHFTLHQSVADFSDLWRAGSDPVSGYILNLLFHTGHTPPRW